MARAFNGTNQWLTVGAAPVTAVPLTLACWAYITDATIEQALMSINDNAATRHRFLLRASGTVAGDPVRAVTTDGGGSAVAASTVGFSVNTWFHAAAVFSAANARAAYFNGGSKGTEATSRTPAGLVRTYVGADNESVTTAHELTAGRIAEAAVWNAALADDEIAMLGLGLSPLFVRPASLVAYWPLIGRTSPEIDRRGRNELTVTGATTADHPRIIYPAQGRIWTPETAVAGGVGLWVPRLPMIPSVGRGMR